MLAPNTQMRIDSSCRARQNKLDMQHSSSLAIGYTVPTQNHRIRWPGGQSGQGRPSRHVEQSGQAHRADTQG